MNLYSTNRLGVGFLAPAPDRGRASAQASLSKKLVDGAGT